MYKTLRNILFSIIFALSIIGKSKAQTYVLIPDANFATYLQGLIPGAMNGSSLNVTNTLVTTCTLINVYSLNITNLDGVQYFTSLQILACSNNNLASLPALPNTVKYLYCSNNALNSLPPLPDSLLTLKCDHNSLASLPILPSKLQYLYCNNNSLTTLPSIPNTLYGLNCCYNALTTLPALSYSLQNLYCNNNSLTSLPSLPSWLFQYFDCSHNSLTNLPTLPNSILTLSCQYNSLTSLPALPISLHDFYCNDNNISCFPTFPTSIASPSYNVTMYYWVYFLDISNNPYTCLPNIISAMPPSAVKPLCAPGNANNCPVANGIQEYKASSEYLNVYPNPCNGSFKIQIAEEFNNGELVIINSIGQVVYTCEIKRGENNITSRITSSGLYQYFILQNKQQFGKGKLIVD